MKKVVTTLTVRRNPHSSAEVIDVLKVESARRYVRKVGLGFLGQEVIFFFGFGLSEVKPYLKRHFKAKMQEGEKPETWQEQGALGKTVPVGGTLYTVVWLKNPPNTPLGVSVLAHESLHAIGFQLKASGIQYCQENDELICQMLDHLMKVVLDDWIP